MKRIASMAVLLAVGACSAPSYTFRVDRAILHGSVQKHVRHELEHLPGLAEIGFQPGPSTVTVRHDGRVTMEALTVKVWVEEGTNWMSISEALYRAGIRTTLIAR